MLAVERAPTPLRKRLMNCLHLMVRQQPPDVGQPKSSRGLRQRWEGRRRQRQLRSPRRINLGERAVPRRRCLASAVRARHGFLRKADPPGQQAGLPPQPGQPAGAVDYLNRSSGRRDGRRNDGLVLQIGGGRCVQRRNSSRRCSAVRRQNTAAAKSSSQMQLGRFSKRAGLAKLPRLTRVHMGCASGRAVQQERAAKSSRHLDRVQRAGRVDEYPTDRQPFEPALQDGQL